MGIVAFRDRQVDLSQPVRIYRNLHKTGVWYSVMQHNKVVGHTQDLLLRDTEFFVGESGRKRVMATGRKTVHAWIAGTVTESAFGTCGGQAARLTYNPKRNLSFIDAATGNPLRGAQAVHFGTDGVTYSYGF